MLPSIEMPHPPTADILSLMSESVSDMIAGPPSDPDAQATITDFLDYTEYLPSDLIRSLTLIGDLDQRYSQSTATVHELTKQYASLSSTDPVALRASISNSLSHATLARESAYAEASRLLDVVNRHSNRLSSIITKLEALPKPPSRDPTPAPQPSPQSVRTKSGRKTGREPAVLPRITLRLDGARPASRPSGSGSRHKTRTRKITVPGEVLPPPNPDSPPPSTESDWTSEPPSPVPIPTARVGTTSTRNKPIPPTHIKIPKLPPPKPPKINPPKPSRPPRPHGPVGTNVRSAVAGISTSNALALLKPPPENIVPGTEDAPWLKLTPWEMAKLRKRMKKNAVWTPSETMIRRELAQLGRGPENYLFAKANAEEAGEELIDHANIAQADSEGQHLDEGEIAIASLRADELKLSTRVTKMKESKKPKKEKVAREPTATATDGEQASKTPDHADAKSRATATAVEAERAANALAATSSALKNIFAKPTESIESPIRQSKSTRKRKRSTAGAGAAGSSVMGDENTSQVSPSVTTSDAKKRKLSTPSVSAISTTNSTTKLPILPPSPLVPSTSKDSPTLPQSPPQSKTKQPTSPKAKNGAAKSTPPPAKQALASRPRSRGNTNTNTPVPVPTPQTLVIPTAGGQRSKRASTLPASPAVSTPDTATRQTRSKRPAPGPVNKTEEGETKISVGKRKAAPRKASALSKKEPAGEEQGPLEEIDPNEPRYCICGDVSWGHMIACENKDCENEWFHMKCVGFPSTRAKWFCPDCCKKLGVGERGQATNTRSSRRSS